MGLDKLTELSSTDKPCQWKNNHKVALAEYDPLPAKEHPQFNVNQPHFVSLTLEDDQRRKIIEIAKGVKNGSFAKRFLRRHEPWQNSERPRILTDAAKNVISEIFASQAESTRHKWVAKLFNHLEITPCCKTKLDEMKKNPIKICIDTALNFDEWLQERRYRVTGTKIYELFTYVSNAQPDWEAKTKKYFNPQTFKTEYTQFGIKHEDEARQTFSNFLNLEVVEVGLVVSAANPWLAASPDGIILDNGKPDRLLEIKNLKDGEKKTVREAIFDGSFKSCLKIIDNQVVGVNPRHKYYGQLQLGMFILNLDEAVFLVYAPFDKSMLTIAVKYDGKFVAKMLKAVKKVYFEKMIHYICDQSCKK